MDSIRPVRSARDHKAALREIDKLLAVKKLTEEQSRRLDALTILVDAYEEKAFPMGGLDPVDLIKAHMSNSGRRGAVSDPPLSTAPLPDSPARRWLL